MEEYPVVTAQLTDVEFDQVHIGMPACTRQSVEMVTRKLRTDDANKGIIVYGYKFRQVMAVA